MKETIQEKNISKATSVVSSVLERIESEAIKPSSWWKFTCINCAVWLAWATTVIFGSTSVAVLVYVSNRTRFELYEATHDTFMAFMLDVLPFIWVFSFVLMVVFAYVNIRNTKCGYRYPLWKMLASSVVFSIGGGVIMHFFGVGYFIDTQFAKSMPLYTSLEHAEEQMWQKPKQGRLLGVLGSIEKDGGEYVFIDTQEKKWNLAIDELQEKDVLLLRSGDIVRLLGTTTSDRDPIFYVCGVFPWMFTTNPTNREMDDSRKVFIKRMYEQMEKSERLRGLEEKVFAKKDGVSFKEDSICAELAMIKRMRFNK